MNSWHSYPSLFAIGHRALRDLFDGPVLVEEKVDGSQFSFGIFEENGNLVVKCKSKSVELNVEAPEKMFSAAVREVLARRDMLQLGWTYRAEYLQKPKHNSLAYSRVPAGHLIIFDINTGHEEYLAPLEKRAEAGRLGLECVPLLAHGKISSADEFKHLLETQSILGGQLVEGVVIKNYAQFGPDKKVLIGKYVSERFKEIHRAEWKDANPTTGDVIDKLVRELRTPARWDKAVLHLQERGELEHDPKDIGKLMKEIPADIAKEETEYIKQRLFEHFWPQIRRQAVKGVPEYYKQLLLADQFTKEPDDEEAIQLTGV